MLPGGALLLAAAIVSACSSTQDVLEPSAITPPTASTTPDPSAPPSQTAAGQPSIVSPRAAAAQSPAMASARIQIAPIVGTSVEAATSLSERLATAARQRGIRMVGSADPAATLQLKGYFTPLVEGKDTTVIYVWDVYDPTGNRVHRISGQHKSSSAGGEGWAAVPAASMQAIGDQTIEQLATWLGSRAG
ncbi:hypothetical protein RB623_21930 [Mesorhizobium sp. LHD-90]|uniref:hypothetical protein n=1 Tax=Mesorhizobium sp. LHD-90 TaxID=3071414 RepID=UPI0027E10195|nr:hypothetical protein [Mesorhizobium sp. LHD-90]MDQ6436719.1 hypothetical protein [Mesorhizobium sp. LHD-90]